MFITDPKTNQVLVNLVQATDYPLLLALLALAIAIPILAAIMAVAALFISMRNYLMQYRRTTLEIEMTLKNLSAVLAKRMVNVDIESVPWDDVEAMRGRTSFFFM
jgi:hypothetical protein